MTLAATTLKNYLQAFCAKDTEKIISLIDADSMIEIPLLKPNRLFGKSEIERGHSATFEAMQSIEFEATSATAKNENAAICFGQLTTIRNDQSIEKHDIGVVIETSLQQVKRISLYFNSRNIRRWSDQTIL